MCNQRKSFGQQKHLVTAVVHMPSFYPSPVLSLSLLSKYTVLLIATVRMRVFIQSTQLICQRSRSRLTPTSAILGGFLRWNFVSFGYKPIELRKIALNMISSRLKKVLKHSFICDYGIIDTYIQMIGKTRNSWFNKQFTKLKFTDFLSKLTNMNCDSVNLVF